MPQPKAKIWRTGLTTYLVFLGPRSGGRCATNNDPVPGRPFQKESLDAAVRFPTLDKEWPLPRNLLPPRPGPPDGIAPTQPGRTMLAPNREPCSNPCAPRSSFRLALPKAQCGTTCPLAVL